MNRLSLIIDILLALAFFAFLPSTRIQMILQLEIPQIAKQYAWLFLAQNNMGNRGHWMVTVTANTRPVRRNMLQETHQRLLAHAQRGI